VSLGKMAFSSLATIDSYNSAAGGYSAATAGSSATVASNDSIGMSGSSSIRGNVALGPGASVSGGTVTGSVSNLPSPLDYPPASTGNAATVNDNANLPPAYFSGGQFTMTDAGTVNVPGGTYYVGKFTMSGTSTLNFTGPTTLYITGTVALSGTSQINPGARPGDLKIRMPPSSKGVSLSNASRINADLYGDGTLVDLSGQSMICGVVLANAFKLSGNAAIHVDTSLAGSAGGSEGAAVLVR